MHAFQNSSARAMVASRSPTPTTEGSTPSGRATPDHQSGYQLIDNCRSIEVPGTAATRSREDRPCRGTPIRMRVTRSEEHSLNSSHMSISYAVFCLKKKSDLYWS